MTVQPLAGFKNLATHHCVTGSMRHVYAFNDHDISEDMLLGIGAGVSFSYFHYKGSDPFMGGRGMPKPSLEELAGLRTGVMVKSYTTTSERKARQSLLELLDAGQPVMLQVDMGFLPYFDFDGQEYHFGGHAIVACGYDSATDTVLIADRDSELYPVSMADLERARGSKFKPFPPKHRWYTFDFSEKLQPTAGEVYEAIQQQAELMLNPPIRNLGIKGIQKAAEVVPQWVDVLEGDKLNWALFNAYIFISPVGGSGGGLFRYMFSRFLHEAADITDDDRLHETAATFQFIGDRWEEVGAWCKVTSELAIPADTIAEISIPLLALADLEQEAWTQLQTIVETAGERQTA